MWQRIGLWLLDRTARALLENRESILEYIVLTVRSFADTKLSVEEKEALRKKGQELLEKLGESFIS